MGDDEVYLLVFLQEGYDVDGFALVLHHFGEVMEDVPVLFVDEAADDTDAFYFLDVVNFLLTWCGLEVANDSLEVYLLDEVHFFIQIGCVVDTR